MRKVRWGILSTAKIGREKVIPALQAGQYSEVVAIGSRNKEQAQAVAGKLHIPVVHGSYDELINDPGIDAVYIPLPNHLHVEWAIRSLEAGKHVLCEKPIGLSVAEAEQLLKAAKARPELKVMEAFMYRFHPQWIHARKLVKDKTIGELKTIQSFFSYFNTDPVNIRNKKEMGGGALMDIGCYCISLSRFLFDREPAKVFGSIETDPASGVDRLASAILDFSTGLSSFTCSTQSAPYQRVNILGTDARIEIEIPFNAPPASATRLWVHTKGGSEEVLFDPVNQYTLQGDLFSKAILENRPSPTSLEDAIDNMKVIGAVFSSASAGTWI